MLYVVMLSVVAPQQAEIFIFLFMQFLLLQAVARFKPQNFSTNCTDYQYAKV
jgi:hypothetical protein